MTDQMIRMAGTVEVQAAAGGGKGVKILAYSGDVMRVDGFGPIVVDLKGMQIPDVLPLLADHENATGATAGSASPVTDGRTLSASGSLTEATEAGKRIMGLLADKVPLQASIGADPVEKRYIREGETVTANGRTITAGRGGLQFISKSRLREISVTPNGADGTTSVIAASKGNKMTEDTLSKEDTKAIIKAAGKYPEIAAQAIDEGWSIDKTELEAIKREREEERSSGRQQQLEHLRASRPTAPAASGSSDRPEFAQILECSVAASLGVSEKTLKASYSEAVINEAYSREHRGAGFHSVIRACHAQQGMTMPTTVGNDEIRASFSPSIKASAYSTFSLPGVLGNALNKSLLDGYRGVETIWSRLAKTAPVKDFKEATRYRLNAKGRFEKVGPGGNLHHISLAEDSYTNQAETWGMMLAVTRQDIINDDLGAFANLAPEIGRLSAVGIEEQFWTLVLSNPSSFFATGNGNLLTGTGSALALIGLKAADLAFAQIVDPNGKPILISPKYLVVPPELRITGQSLIGSQYLNEAATAGTPAPSGNPWNGRFEVLSSPFLSNSSISGYSTTAWYLFAEPGSVAAAEVCFLNGQQFPVLETAETDFNTLGMQWRSYFDFGIAMQDYRAAQKNTGVAP